MSHEIKTKISLEKGKQMKRHVKREFALFVAVYGFEW